MFSDKGRLRSKKKGIRKSPIGKMSHADVFSVRERPYERRKVDKNDRATVEQVLDRRTRMVIVKLLSGGILSEINGCVSTGKEANVYYATGERKNNEIEGQVVESSYAVKIFKTSILVFKDRERYVQGEFRFRRGYSKHNPRKMVTLWAEKEFRNLIRLSAAGVRVPKPVALRRHVLVMEFLGEEGWPSKRLKDALPSLSPDEKRVSYRDMCLEMSLMYRECHLVHGDLSEYNALWYKEQVWIIDVSQSVEFDHPNALLFLRADCTNVTNFFRKFDDIVACTARELFDFITDTNIVTDADAEVALDTILEKSAERIALTNEELVLEEAFRRVHIARTLQEVEKFERDYYKMKEGGDTGDVYYQNVVGMKKDLTGPDMKADEGKFCEVGESNNNNNNNNNDDDDDDDDDDDGDSDDSSDDSDSEDDEDDEDQILLAEDVKDASFESFENEQSDNERVDINTENTAECSIVESSATGRDRNETLEEKRMRKETVRQEKSQRRQNKIPKHIKKQQMKKKNRK